MRPRHYAAENCSLDFPCSTTAMASMRPRHYAAENIGTELTVFADALVLQ